MQGVIHGFDGTDDEVHLAVIHFQPGLVAVVVIIRLETFDHLKQIVPDALLDGDVGGLSEIFLNLADGSGIGFMVPDRFEAAVRSAPYERVGAVFLRILPRKEFLPAHVGRIEAGPGRAAAISRKEGLPVEAVPGTVVDLGIFPLGRICQGLQEGVPIREVLLPVDFVHLIGGHPVKPQDFFTVVGDARQVRGGDGHLGVLVHKPAHIHPVPGTGNGDQGKKQKHS